MAGGRKRSVGCRCLGRGKTQPVFPVQASHHGRRYCSGRARGSGGGTPSGGSRSGACSKPSGPLSLPGPCGPVPLVISYMNVPLAADGFRDALARFASGVTIVAARHPSGLVGFTATAFSALSLCPPLVLACVGKKASAYDRILTCEHVGVSILDERQAPIAAQFARSGIDRFAGIRFRSAPATESLSSRDRWLPWSAGATRFTTVATTPFSSPRCWRPPFPRGRRCCILTAASDRGWSIRGRDRGQAERSPGKGNREHESTSRFSRGQSVGHVEVDPGGAASRPATGRSRPVDPIVFAERLRCGRFACGAAWKRRRSRDFCPSSGVPPPSLFRRRSTRPPTRRA